MPSSGLVHLLLPDPARWLTQERDRSPHWQHDAELRAQISEIHEDSGGTYGSPRVHAVLRRRGEAVAREDGRQDEFLRKRWRTESTRHIPRATPAPDRVNRDFTAAGPTGCGWPTQPGSPARRGCSGWPWCAMH